MAIVSDIAGTTRDLLEVHLDISGLPVNIVDTAGLRESRDEIESEGIRRAENRAKDADLKIVIVDSAHIQSADKHMQKHIDGDTMVLFNKSDLDMS